MYDDRLDLNFASSLLTLFSLKLLVVAIYWELKSKVVSLA